MKLTLFALLLAGPAPETEPPSVLFILTDDHHHQGLSAAGNPRIRTPRLDALAASGVRFAGAIAASPQCAPGRASLLTGLYPHQSGILSNQESGRGTGRGAAAPEGRWKEPTAIERMRAAGHHTALIGKWHLPVSPGKSGFAEVRLWTRKGQERYQDPPLARGEEGPLLERRGHITDLLTDDALAFLGENRGRRFFLWLAYTAPHSPITEPPEYEEPYRGRSAGELAPPAHAPLSDRPVFDWARYYSALGHLDQAVGRLVDGLERLGLRDRTLVVLLGDNGFVGGAFSHVGKVLPLEDSIRVPLLISLPGRVRAGAAHQGVVSSLDVTATWLDLAGAPRPSGHRGESLWPLLRAEGRLPPEKKPKPENTEERDRTGGRAVFSEFAGERAMFGPVDPYRLVRTQDRKYVLHRSGRERLFDLAADPHELRDLAGDASFQAARQELRERLRAWMEETGDKEGLRWLTGSRGGRF